MYACGRRSRALARRSGCAAAWRGPRPNSDCDLRRCRPGPDGKPGAELARPPRCTPRWRYPRTAGEQRVRTGGNDIGGMAVTATETGWAPRRWALWSVPAAGLALAGAVEVLTAGLAVGAWWYDTPTAGHWIAFAILLGCALLHVEFNAQVERLRERPRNAPS